MENERSLEPAYVNQDTKHMKVEVAFYVTIEGEYFNAEELEEHIEDVKHSIKGNQNVKEVECEKI